MEDMVLIDCDIHTFEIADGEFIGIQTEVDGEVDFEMIISRKDAIWLCKSLQDMIGDED